MPGQYITGNQLYSGLPYGMTQPMGYGGFGGGYGGGKGGGFGSPYGMSQQYMPNRGLMGGYSTGFGPYGGYQRPRFGGGYGGGYGGGKGGPRIQPYPYPMNPYAMGGGGINPVVGPNGERLYDTPKPSFGAGDGSQISDMLNSLPANYGVVGGDDFLPKPPMMR